VCHIASTPEQKLNYPNGITKGADGLYYIPSAMTGKMWVMQLHTNKTLTTLSSYQLDRPMDNLSEDSKGDIYAASFPSGKEFIEATHKPFELNPPMSVHKFRYSEEKGWDVVKVLEDDGSVLPGTTVGVHDPKTGRIFVGGASAPYIGVCEPK
jgi:arylesterase / paraoxonase